MTRAAHGRAAANAAAHEPQPTIVFSHANGFPASTYRVLFDVWRKAGWRVHALEKIGHDPAYPVTSNWPHLRDQLTEFVRREAGGTSVVFVGHSLGGYLSLLAACQCPELARAVVLLDSPLVAGWRAHSLHMAKISGLISRISPAKVAQRRRHDWPDVDAVQAHFAGKAAFARWDPRVLADYVQHGTVASAAGRSLSFRREVEARIYDTLPHHMPQLMKRHPLKAPAAFVAGTQSIELRQVGLAATRRLTHGRISWIEGSHLYPFERPVETAREVLRWIDTLLAA